MWSGVLLCDPGSQAPAQVNSVVVIPAGDTAALIDAVGKAGGHVVLAAPASLAAELSLMSNIVSGRWPEIGVARLTSSHAPLAILSALALARQVTDQPGLGHALVRAVLEHSWSGAWVSSLVRLAEPAPTIGQHLRSLLPGAGFMVRQAPQPAVLGSPGVHDVPNSELARVLLVQGTGVPVGLVRRMAELSRAVSVHEVNLPGTWASVYGGPSGQVTLVPFEPAQLLPTYTLRCPTCGLRQAEAVCPFCRTLVPGVAEHGAAA